MQERGVSRQPLLEVLGAALVLIGLWSFAAYSFGILALPAPLAVFRHLFGEALIGIMPHLGISLYRILVGLSLSLLFAVPLGMILGQVPAIDRLLAPMIYLVYPIPKIVLLPLFLILVGIGDLSKILLICVIVFFQLLVSTRDAAKAIDPRLIQSVRCLGAKVHELYRYVIFPACLPKIFSCLRISLGTSLAVLFLAETYATNQGIGFYIMDAFARFDYVDVFAGVVAMSAMGMLLYFTLDLLERRFCRWMWI